MKKGEFLIRKDETIWQIAGRRDNDIVLVSTDDDNEAVLIYGSAELEGLIAGGHFRKMYKTGIKIST